MPWRRFSPRCWTPSSNPAARPPQFSQPRPWTMSRPSRVSSQQTASPSTRYYPTAAPLATGSSSEATFSTPHLRICCKGISELSLRMLTRRFIPLRFHTKPPIILPHILKTVKICTVYGLNIGKSFLRYLALIMKLDYANKDYLNSVTFVKGPRLRKKTKQALWDSGASFSAVAHREDFDF